MHDAQQKWNALTPTEVRAARQSSYYWAVGFLIFDAALYLATVLGSVTLPFWTGGLACSVIAGFCTSGLLIIAHDSCHNSLTPCRPLNRIIGALAFLPALHNYSLWRHGHNFVHHLYTNQRGKDYVWEPLSPTEYRQLTRWKQMKYRFFRSFPGHYFYYTFEMWWRWRVFPQARYVGVVKPVYWWDLGLVMGWLLGLSAVLVIARCDAVAVPLTTWMEWPVAVSRGIAIPFLVSGMLMSTTEYMHHTHPAVHWYRDLHEENWSAYQAKVSVHVRYPQPLDWVVHWIMDHTAHHIQPTVPLYQLRGAQQLIESRTVEVITYDFSFRHLRDILRRCKLYDDRTGCWRDFVGHPTSASRCDKLSGPLQRSVTAVEGNEA